MVKRVRMITDIAMTVLLPLLMAYALIGETFHEIAGIVMFGLFIAHLILNRRWFRSLGKGKMTAFRMVQACVNIALVVIMFVLPVSGIMTSKHLFSFLPTDSFTSISRTVHMLASYWGFVIMSFHAGMHISQMKKKVANISANVDSEQSKAKGVMKVSPGQIAGNIILTAAMGYGVFAFIRRGIYMYMFLISQFVFFDYSEPLVFFFIDYVAVMVLFAGGGHFIKKLLTRRRGQRFE